MDVEARIETRIESRVVEIVDRSGGVPVAADAVMDRMRPVAARSSVGMSTSSMSATERLSSCSGRASSGDTLTARWCSPAMLPHCARRRGRGSVVHTIRMARSRTAHGARPWNRPHTARDPGDAGQVEEATVTTATRDRQTAATRAGRPGRAAPDPCGRRRCSARRRRGLLGDARVRGDGPGPGRWPTRLRRIRRVRRVRRVCRVRRRGDPGVPAGDGGAVGRRRAHRHGAALPGRSGRRNRDGPHRLGSGAHQLPRRRGRGHDHRHRGGHRAELPRHRGRHRPDRRRRAAPAHRGLRAAPPSRPTTTRPRSATRSPRSATPAVPGP